MCTTFINKYMNIYKASDGLFLHGRSNVIVRIHREGYETGYSCLCAQNYTWSCTQDITQGEVTSSHCFYYIHHSFPLIASMEKSQVAC